MGKGAVAGTVVLLAVAAAAIGFYVVPRLEEPQEEETETAETVAPPTVQVTTPRRGKIEIFRSLIGSVAPSDLVTVIPMAAGEITEVYVNTGDYVEANQVLCDIDTKQVGSAKLQLDAAGIQLNDAQTNLNRMTVLYESGDIAAQTYEQAVSSLNAAQVQYNSAKLAYDTQVEFSHVTAPIAGRIESSSMEVHGMATQSSPLCAISGEDAKTVMFSVTEAMLEHVKEGETVRIEKSGSSYTGTITEVGTTVSSTTGLFDVKAQVADADALISGSTVRLSLTADKAENVLTLPVDVIYYRNSRPYVYTYDNGIVHEVEIETGISDDEKIEIISGLSASDQVITTWSPELYENAPALLEEEDS